jgi:transglutaminase-like putative cysteine protease
MSLERWFSLLQYVTLGLSCTALVFAEEPFLPELQICLAPVLVLLLVAWWVEGRWALPNWGANILGGLIAAAGFSWLVKQLSDNDFVLAHLPLHLALLPYMGPLAMASLLVKVFRQRDAGHFWHVQIFALMQIGLGCVLDGGPDFGVTTVAYLASALACLALHYRLSIRRGARGEGGEVRDLLLSPLAPRPSPLATRRWLLSFTMGWTLLISVAALLLFLLTPRRDNWSWQPLNRFRAGYSRGPLQSDSEEMNLNNIGRIELDEEIAFSVTAVDAAGQPKLDLPADQRWRGSVLDWYEHGKWSMMHVTPPRRPRKAQEELPDFGPDQFFLNFRIQPRQAGGLVLAEPIRFGRFPTRLPVIALAGAGERHLFAEIEGTVLSQVFTDWRRVHSYRQVMPPLDDPSPRAAVIASAKDISELTNVPTSLREPLQAWTLDLLRRLSTDQSYRLPPSLRAALAESSLVVALGPNYWKAAAGALTAYLANSGEFSYSLELVRHNRGIDPVLDFLINVKQGHCERYAAALALMLRSLGVPARVVKGFRGCDHLGKGQYVVRHSHAHAWVEILVPHEPERGVRGEAAARAAGLETGVKGQRRTPGRFLQYDWLTLDATPTELAPAAHGSSLAYLWDEVHRFCQHWWRSLIVEYNGDEQADLWETLTSGPPLLAVLRIMALAAAAFAVALAVRQFLRRLRQRSAVASRDSAISPRLQRTLAADSAIYPRLVRILGRYASLQPAFGQTPREYGAAAQAFLQARPALAALAELPKRAIELFYRVRFGARPLREGERKDIDAELDHFSKSLQRSGRKSMGSMWRAIYRFARNDKSLPPRSPTADG